MGKILISGGLIPTTPNTLLDAREKVATFAKIADIENPALYMTIIVEDTGKKYEVRKLTSKVIGGIVVQNAAIDINDPEALLDLGLAEEQRKKSEAQRQKNESQRQRNEEGRQEDERSRNTYESQRRSSENNRNRSENARLSAEESRLEAENKRAANENKRQSQESTRQSQEISRVNAENTRSDNENARKSAESERSKAEDTRNASELERKNAENARSKSEQSRVSAENTRSSAEDRRVANENQRVANETSRNNAELSREQAEGNRASTFVNLKGELETTIQEGREANTLSEAATQRANEAANTIETWESVVVTVEDEGDVNDPESDIVNEAIRKTPQTLSKAEQAQARTNIGAASLEENNAFKKEVTDNFDTYKTETTERLNEEFSELQQGVDESIKGFEEYLEAMEYKMYGVEFDTSVSSPSCTRIGNSSLHRTLPIHNRMKGCLLDDDGNVVEYLNPTDWTGNTRDGSRGQVMVELPEHYRKFETDGTKRRVLLSEYPLPGYHLVPKMYVSAYEASVQRSTTKLCSVVNADADYRGGNNTTSYDGTYRSLLGRPATKISRTNFRNYARKRKSGSTEWNCMTYNIQKELYWLFVVEYATLNSQAAYNAAKDSNGYAQGGLGDGVTTWSSDAWNGFNAYNPFVPCGYTDSLGNGTGLVKYTVKDSADADLKTFSVPRYRGVENPFGHIWQWTDGINVRISPTEENGGDGLSKVFVCSDPAKFNDSNYNGYSHVGNEARTEGYVKSVIFGEYGEIMPDAVGGGSTTYHCDYHYTNIPTVETLRGVYFGGHACYGAYAGFACADSHSAPSATHSYGGSRLCFIPNQKTNDNESILR